MVYTPVSLVCGSPVVACGYRAVCHEDCNGKGFFACLADPAGMIAGHPVKITNCINPAVEDGLCEEHYTQRKKFEELREQV